MDELREGKRTFILIGVAILIISLIFHLYGNYLRTLQGFL